MFAVIFASVTFARAQEPIVLDEIKPGEITDANSQPEFEFTASPGQNLEIEVLALSEGMVPQFIVLQASDALGVWYALSPETSIKSAITLEEGGSYRVQVGTTNGTRGQFVITLREVVPPLILIANTPTGGPLMAGDRVTYILESDPANRLALTITGQGIEADLFDAGGELVGNMTSSITGGYYLPANSGAYSIEIRSATAEDASYQLSLGVSE